jgi:uncharacterized protein with von Willebrand factor type A (vWA) domain
MGSSARARRKRERESRMDASGRSEGIKERHAWKTRRLNVLFKRRFGRDHEMLIILDATMSTPRLANDRGHIATTNNIQGNLVCTKIMCLLCL